MCLVAVGTPYYKIIEVAEAEKVDLIVMATHGRTGLGHLVMGSVAERVAHGTVSRPDHPADVRINLTPARSCGERAPRHRLKRCAHISQEGITMEFHHILAPTDFSEYSQQAIQYARELAQTFGAALMLLHVVELPPYPIEGLPPSQLKSWRIWSNRRPAT